MTNDKQRERLVELLGDYLYSEQIADHLLKNGVIVPPCKVGQTVYFLHRLENYITEHKVDNFYVGKKGMSIRISGVMNPVKPYEFGRIFFTAIEEAEEALKGGAE